MKNKLITKKNVLIVGAVAVAGAILVVPPLIGIDGRYRILKRDVFSQESGIETVVYTEFGYEIKTNSGNYSMAYLQVFVFSESEKLLFKRNVSPQEAGKSDVFTKGLEGLKGQDYRSAKPIRYEELDRKSVV